MRMRMNVYPPRDVHCTPCLKRWDVDRDVDWRQIRFTCNDCAGTGFEPIPHAEVMRGHR